jgi:hypothetical protein
LPEGTHVAFWGLEVYALFDAAGKRYNERGTLAFAATFYSNCSPVQFHEMSNDSETKAEPTVLACAGRIRLAKSFKDMGQEFRFDADACIRDRYREFVVCLV